MGEPPASVVSLVPSPHTPVSPQLVDSADTDTVDTQLSVVSVDSVDPTLPPSPWMLLMAELMEHTSEDPSFNPDSEPPPLVVSVATVDTQPSAVSEDTEDLEDTVDSVDTDWEVSDHSVDTQLSVVSVDPTPLPSLWMPLTEELTELPSAYLLSNPVLVPTLPQPSVVSVLVFQLPQASVVMVAWVAWPQSAEPFSKSKKMKFSLPDLM